MQCLRFLGHDVKPMKLKDVRGINIFMNYEQRHSYFHVLSCLIARLLAQRTLSFGYNHRSDKMH